MTTETVSLIEAYDKLLEENKLLKMSLEEKNENCYSLAKENAELKKQKENLEEKLHRIQPAYLKFQKEFKEIDRELEQVIMIR